MINIPHLACRLTSQVFLWSCCKRASDESEPELGTCGNYHFYVMKNVIFCTFYLKTWIGVGYINRAQPRSSLFLKWLIDLELIFLTTLQNRKPQMPGSGSSSWDNFITTSMAPRMPLMTSMYNLVLSNEPWRKGKNAHVRIGWLLSTLWGGGETHTWDARFFTARLLHEKCQALKVTNCMTQQQVPCVWWGMALDTDEAIGGAYVWLCLWPV